MSMIDLMIDEENELTFQVQIEGTRPGQARCRLMLESHEMTLGFDGSSSGNEVTVILPPLDHVLKEGKYDMTLEVVVDDRYFEPLKIQGSFEKRLQVTAESVVVKTKPRIKTSASLVEVKKSESPVQVRVASSPRKEKRITETHDNKKQERFSDQDILDLIKNLSKGK